MYNRYIRNDQGGYTRIPQEDAPPPRQEGRPAAQAPEPDPPPRGSGGPPPGADPPPAGGLFGGEGLPGALRGILDQLHLDRIDSGDLLLLGLLFLLFREGADEELLVALGLLLIL